MANLHQLTSHSTTSCLLAFRTTWRSYRDHRIL